MFIGAHRKFVENETAGVTVEFVALMPTFLLFTFFVIEILIAQFWVGTVEKAAQLGARLAVVSDNVITTTSACPPAAGIPLTNCLATGFIYGDGCGGSPDHCNSFTDRVCTANGTTCSCTGGGTCNTTAFNYIVGRMHGISGLIQTQYDPHTTITYKYIGLGYAGGPIVPSVTVTLSGIPYGTLLTDILGNFFKKASGNNTATSPLTNLPPISVTITGEDLSTSGAP
jgi:hypothetical protein